MAKQYPNIGASRKWPPAKRKKCVVCGLHAPYRVDIQVDWLRGNDEVVNACEQHRADIDALLEAQEGKPNGRD